MRTLGFNQPPRSLRKAKLDNIAIVPASLLPFKEQYQQLANDLPDGDLLICVPRCGKAQRDILERAAAALRAKGWRVTTVSSEKVRYQPSSL